MEPFLSCAGRVVPLRRSNVDTDQIIPARHLKRVSRTGFADGVFAAWRADPNFVLDDPARAGAVVLVAGPDFGTGSSREHAVWALLEYGFRAVIAPRFGDIFRSNALSAGLLPVQLPTETVDALMLLTERDPAVVVTVDLVAREVRSGALVATFDIDGDTRRRLMEGLDEITLTLRAAAAIDAYEARRDPWLPRTTAPLE